MEELATTMLINFLKDVYLNEENSIKLQHVFESYQRLEIARLRSAFSCGRLEQVKGSDTTGQDYVNNKFKSYEKQIIKLENGMFVICPEGEVAPYLTNGKKYEVYNVEEYENDGIVGYSFNIKDDDEEEIPCIIHNVYVCAHLNGKHWIIDNPEKP